MKMAKPLLLLQLLLLQLILSAQVQWYQNQDGNSLPPNGTTGVSLQALTTHSFVACYQWTIHNDDYTWKISKSHINGTEQRTFFITGPSAQVEIKVGQHYSIYVLERSFPFGQNTAYTVYQLDSNLNIKAQRDIAFPNSFNVFNMNAFELDNAGNVYFAGDGQYPDGPGFRPASFVLKTDKNLVTQWSRMDSTQTSFTRLHIDRWGQVLVIADFYSFFPDVRLTRISPNGKHAQTTTIHTNAGRFNLFSTLDDDENLLLYGGKFIGDTAQAMYLYKVSHLNGRIIYSKTHFTSAGSQLNDLKVDGHGNIFCLVSQYFGPGNQVARISRINSYNGNISWNRSFSYAEDSCNLFKLVMNENDQFYAVGEKKRRDIFSRGFAVRLKRNGQSDGNYTGPDSVAFQRSHWLVDGIIDRNNQLIALGNTNDLDTITSQSSYFRSFAVRFGTNNNNNHNNNNDCNSARRGEDIPVAEESNLNNPLVIYPNPVQNQLIVANLPAGEYDRMVVYSLQGGRLLQQSINGMTARMNVTALPNGTYLLVLHSNASSKEKSIKFVVSR
jgi:Secretion system C-terminal sorting domain